MGYVTQYKQNKENGAKAHGKLTLFGGCQSGNKNCSNDLISKTN